MRRVAMFIAVGVLVLSVVGCSGDEAPQNPDPGSIEVFQIFRPQLPYGKEGSAGGAVLVEDSELRGSVDLVPSDPNLTPQTLGRIEADPGEYRFTAFQKACGSDCPPSDPRLSRTRSLEVSCSQRIDTDRDLAVLIYVNPERRECIAEPSEQAPKIRCSDSDALLSEVIDAYPAIDWDLPTEACVVDLGRGRILDVFFNGQWGAMRRDRVGQVG